MNIVHYVQFRRTFFMGHAFAITSNPLLAEPSKNGYVAIFTKH